MSSAQQSPKSTVLIMGDQINRGIASLADKTPDDTRILFIELATKFSDKQWHKQKVHLLLSALKHFAQELREEGFEVDYRIARNLSEGVKAHKRDFDVSHVIAMEPMNWNGKKILENLDIELVRNNQFLCHYEDFAEWTTTKTKFKMEDFYRWQRKRLDILMDGSTPCEGKWNFDHDNRERPPRDGREWPPITLFEHDDI
ncbi:MAG: cryptochrome/photolyase family protein, partial [Actinomycetota bacterium]|nr:cryptochrome/photolyase family protein [Actinomycetota bacterium]